jgi:hypothetical protein
MNRVKIDAGGVFVGIARNVRPYIAHVLANAERRSEVFSRSRIVVVENDSTDGTQDELRRWAAASEAHIYVSADGVASGDFGTRTERLAYYRNIYLREIEKGAYDGFDYVVIFDCDNVNSGWVDNEAFADAVRFLAQEEERAAAFANTRGFYYDIWTLRHPSWCATDCWQDVERMRSFTSYTEAVVNCVGGRQIRIKPTCDPIPVTSAFGGLGIYKRRYLLGKQYFARSRDGSPICEHVSVNEQISGDGGKLFIFPPLVVGTPYEHIHRPRDRTYYRTRLAEYLAERRAHWKSTSMHAQPATSPAGR